MTSEKNGQASSVYVVVIVIVAAIAIGRGVKKLKRTPRPTKFDLGSLPKSMISVEIDGDSWQRPCEHASKRYKGAGVNVPVVKLAS
jgi:hypothetical protein